jgi:hypothetical protein
MASFFEDEAAAASDDSEAGSEAEGHFIPSVEGAHPKKQRLDDQYAGLETEAEIQSYLDAKFYHFADSDSEDSEEEAKPIAKQVTFASELEYFVNQTISAHMRCAFATRYPAAQAYRISYGPWTVRSGEKTYYYTADVRKGMEQTYVRCIVVDNEKAMADFETRICDTAQFLKMDSIRCLRVLVMYKRPFLEPVSAAVKEIQENQLVLHAF